MGNDKRVVVSHRLCGFERRGWACCDEGANCGHTKVQVSSLHIFCQVSQSVTVIVRVDHCVKRKKFTVNNPCHVKK
jgi:hypothetical protein